MSQTSEFRANFTLEININVSESYPYVIRSRLPHHFQISSR